MKITLYILVLLVFTSCKNITPTNTSTHFPIEKGSENFKYNLFRSGIIEYKTAIKGGANKLYVWDNWGAVSYEDTENMIIYTNYGTVIQKDKFFKKETKEKRDFTVDAFISYNQNLRAYYLPKEFTPHMKKTNKHEVVAGKPCTVWSDGVRRMCLYKNKIPLKFEACRYPYSQNEVSEKECQSTYTATRVVFDVPVDIQSYNPPNLSKEEYRENLQIHKRFRNTKEGQGSMRSVLEHWKDFYGKVMRGEN